MVGAGLAHWQWAILAALAALPEVRGLAPEPNEPAEVGPSVGAGSGPAAPAAWTVAQAEGQEGGRGSVVPECRCECGDAEAAAGGWLGALLGLLTFGLQARAWLQGRPRGARLVLETGRVGTEEAILLRLRPGQAVAVTHGVDALWHERLLVGTSAEELGASPGWSWRVITPGGDECEDALDGSQPGPHRLATLAVDGSPPRVLRGRFYRFAECPTDELLVRRAVGHYRMLAWAGAPHRPPKDYVNGAGQVVPWPDEARREMEAAVVPHGPDAVGAIVGPTDGVGVPAGSCAMLKQHASDLYVKCLLVRKSEVDGRLRELLDLAAAAVRPAVHESDAGGGKGTDAPVAGRPAAVAEDCRTLWVDFDPRGERFKVVWRQVCLESRSEKWGDGPAPRCCAGWTRVFATVATLGRAAASRGVRDLFPLPCEEVPERPAGRGGRRLQRWRRRRRESDFVDSAAQALNWMHVCGLGHVVQGEPDNMRQDVLEYVHWLAQGEQRACRHLDAPSTQVALLELLRGRSLYGAGATKDSLASFQQGRLSLPESVEGSPHIGDVCGRRGLCVLEREGERMLEPVAEVAADLELDGARCYCDPALVKHKTVYVTFLKDLMPRGLLDCTLEPLENAGIFCVWCQEELACAVPPLSPDSLLRDRDARGALRRCIYVGNMGIVGAESERVRSTLDGVTEAFMQKGLLVHEQAMTSGVSEVMGVEIDGQLMQTRASGKRRLRARQAIAGSPAVRSRSGVAVPSSSSSAGAASEGTAPPAGGRERVLWRRRKQRVLAYVEEAWDTLSADASLPEQKAVQRQTRKQYQAELDRWQEFASLGDLKLVSDEKVDEMLVRFFERDFFLGEQAHRGTKLLAALMHAEPGFGRRGSRRVPRAWRALKGWGRLAPGAIAPAGAALSLGGDESFLAPKRPDGYWSLLAHPAQRGVPDKIGEFDRSMLLDSSLSSELQWSITGALLCELAYN
ncbi:unnamed protein product [Prorocentrum cordatum]|uniref:RNA-directed RNA polymerase n=1 Tax=Prorocentrum cordatum TaxID=2364126 RepID=A0ABN9VWB2_9DINO|nr:unnamed protein product [Polarella glacialis]